MSNFSFIDFLDIGAVLPGLSERAPDPKSVRGARVDAAKAPKDVHTRNYPTEIFEAARRRCALLRVHQNVSPENWRDDLPCRDSAALKSWSQMRRLVGQARAAILSNQPLRGVLDPDAPTGRIILFTLAPGMPLGWHIDDSAYDERHMRFHVPLVTNPRAFLYCLDEMMHLAAGSLWLFNTRVVHSAANWGTEDRIHLVIEMRKRGA